MKKYISLTLGLAFASTLIGNAFAAYTYNNTNTTFCTQDAYICPNGTTVGRTGSNCQFTCPSTYVAAPVHNSYSYTSGCYTYYFNGTTNTTTILSNNCSNNYNYTYTNTYNQNQGYTYSYPTTYTYPQPVQTQYTYPYTYGYTYLNNVWTPNYNNVQYYNTTNYGNYGYTDTGYNSNYNSNYYSNYNSNYNTNYNTNYTSNGCYYQGGYQVCY